MIAGFSDIGPSCYPVTKLHVQDTVTAKYSHTGVFFHSDVSFTSHAIARVDVSTGITIGAEGVRVQCQML